MSDDIVNRLRSEHKTEHNGITFRFTPTKDELEAADEIERLRVDGEAWEKIAKAYARKLHGMFCGCGTCDYCEANLLHETVAKRSDK